MRGVEERGVGGREGRRSMPSVCIVAIGTRSYCPVHSFIVVIEIRALSLLSSALVVVIELRVTSYCWFCVMTHDDLMMKPKMLPSCSSSLIVKSTRGQHTRHSRRWGLAQAERLRDSYWYSFLLSSALLHCCDRNACTQLIVQRTRFCDRIACYSVLLLLCVIS